jgi:hypothetical protein
VCISIYFCLPLSLSLSLNIYLLYPSPYLICVYHYLFISIST